MGKPLTTIQFLDNLETLDWSFDGTSVVTPEGYRLNKTINENHPKDDMLFQVVISVSYKDRKLVGWGATTPEDNSAMTAWYIKTYSSLRTKYMNDLDRMQRNLEALIIGL
jgi:hypothetical protein